MSGLGGGTEVEFLGRQVRCWTRFGRGPRRGRFVERATEASNITPEVLPGGDPWRTWRGLPLGEMVLNL
jgi:hypothetical protein